MNTRQIFAPLAAVLLALAPALCAAQPFENLLQATSKGDIQTVGTFLNQGLDPNTADADGNMVSLIQSNFRGFGSGVVPGDLGFVLQSRGELFALQPGHANVYAPGKRPFHTIIPAFVTRDGKPWLSFGVMGGDMQPQGHVQVLVNLIDFGMSLQAAGDAPRVRHSGSSAPTGERMINGGTVWLEPGFSATTIAALEKLGHRVQVQAGGYGGYQAIRHDAKEKVYHGASESRKDGHAAGY